MKCAVIGGEFVTKTEQMHLDTIYYNIKFKKNITI